jgi:hypothetical protein
MLLAIRTGTHNSQVEEMQVMMMNLSLWKSDGRVINNTQPDLKQRWEWNRKFIRNNSKISKSWRKCSSYWDHHWLKKCYRQVDVIYHVSVRKEVHIKWKLFEWRLWTNQHDLIATYSYNYIMYRRHRYTYSRFKVYWSRLVVEYVC